MAGWLGGWVAGWLVDGWVVDGWGRRWMAELDGWIGYVGRWVERWMYG